MKKDKDVIAVESDENSSLPMYQSISQNDQSPWLTNITKDIHNPLFRLHNEIIQFSEYILPSKKDHQQR